MDCITATDDLASAHRTAVRSAWQTPVLRVLQANEAEHGDSGRPEAITYS